MKRYDGNENATESTIRQYLIANYRWDYGRGLTDENARKLMQKYPEIVVSGIKMMSFASYVGDKIADNETELLEIELPDDDEEDE